MEILDLPEEIIIHILSFLPASDILNVRQAVPSWHTWVQSKGVWQGKTIKWENVGPILLNLSAEQLELMHQIFKVQVESNMFGWKALSSRRFSSSESKKKPQDSSPKVWAPPNNDYNAFLHSCLDLAPVLGLLEINGRNFPEPPEPEFGKGPACQLHTLKFFQCPTISLPIMSEIVRRFGDELVELQVFKCGPDQDFPSFFRNTPGEAGQSAFLFPKLQSLISDRMSMKRGFLDEVMITGWPSLQRLEFYCGRESMKDILSWRVFRINNQRLKEIVLRIDREYYYRRGEEKMVFNELKYFMKVVRDCPLLHSATVTIRQRVKFELDFINGVGTIARSGRLPTSFSIPKKVDGQVVAPDNE